MEEAAQDGAARCFLRVMKHHPRLRHARQRLRSKRRAITVSAADDDGDDDVREITCGLQRSLFVRVVIIAPGRPLTNPVASGRSTLTASTATTSRKSAVSDRRNGNAPTSSSAKTRCCCWPCAVVLVDGETAGAMSGLPPSETLERDFGETWSLDRPDGYVLDVVAFGPAGVAYSWSDRLPQGIAAHFPFGLDAASNRAAKDEDDEFASNALATSQPLWNLLSDGQKTVKVFASSSCVIAPTLDNGAAAPNFAEKQQRLDENDVAAERAVSSAHTSDHPRTSNPGIVSSRSPSSVFVVKMAGCPATLLAMVGSAAAVGANPQTSQPHHQRRV